MAIAPARTRAFLITMAFCTHLATPASADLEGARASADLFKQARAKKEAEGCAAALPLFEESHRLHPGRGRLLNIAICEVELARLVSAFRHFSELERQFDGDPARRKIVAQHLAQLERRLPRLRMELVKDFPSGAQVKLDGAPVPPSYLDGEAPIDPGKHTILVSAPGHADLAQDFKIAEGERRLVLVSPGPTRPRVDTPSGRYRPPTGPSTSTPPTAKAVESAPNRTAMKRTAGFVMGGAAITGITIGVATGVATAVHEGELRAACPKMEGCAEDVVNKAGVARGLYRASLLASAAGVACAGAAAYLLLSSRPVLRAIQPTVSMAPGVIELRLHGAF